MMKDDHGLDTSQIVALALAFLMTGYWGGDTAGGAGSSCSPQEEIAPREEIGGLPVLECEPTLGGIDANTNGVRDDIERHIEKKYTEPAQRKAAMQTARAYQQMLLVDKKDMAALDAASEASSRAIVCAK